jgi:hypothetical protein
MPKSKLIFIQFEFDSDKDWLKEGMSQIAKRREKGKAEREGVKVNDRSLLKKLAAKKEIKRIEVSRISCFVIFDTTLLAVQAVYRCYHSDGTARETKGAKHYFDSGEFSFKSPASDDSPSKTKLSFKRQGMTVNIKNQDNARGMVSPSAKMCCLRS